MSDGTSEATSTASIERPARRFLHICYCCADDQEVAEFFVKGLDFKQVMRTTDEYGPGTILGIDEDVRSVGNFVYDRRGPRVSPAIEIQGWYDPTPVGEPSTDPFEVGIKALGFGVPALDAAVERLTALGCTVIDNSPGGFPGRQATLIDPRQVTLELAEDQTLAEGESQMHHLRVTTADLEGSLPFYEMLGFEVTQRQGFESGEWAVLRLADEPFEVRLVQYQDPPSHGHHYTEPYHAGIFRAALGVDDTRASYDYLKGTGAVFDRPPMQVELSGTAVPDMWITFISDPNGIPYEFVQRPRSAFR
jgi:catechol 2,3-dioxygenase-like lactoylglutathione lyase family enzyme